MKDGKTYLLAGAIVLALAGTAGASAYLTKQNLTTTTETSSTVTKPVTHVSQRHSDVRWDDNHAQPRTVAAPACNDGNIVGKAVGGVGGGVLGSAIGNGHGKTATTIAGTLGGAYLGGEVIPTQNVTCPK